MRTSSVSLSSTVGEDRTASMEVPAPGGYFQKARPSKVDAHPARGRIHDEHLGLRTVGVVRFPALSDLRDERPNGTEQQESDADGSHASTPPKPLQKDARARFLFTSSDGQEPVVFLWAPAPTLSRAPASSKEAVRRGGLRGPSAPGGRAPVQPIV